MKPETIKRTKANTLVGLGSFFANISFKTIGVGLIISACLVALTCGCKPSPPADAGTVASTASTPKIANGSSSIKTDDKQIETMFHFFYRPTTKQAMGDSKFAKIRIPLVEGTKPGFNNSRVIEFDDIKYEIKATYLMISIHVYTSEGRTIAKQEYVIPDGLKNQFNTNGFTGQQLFYHPTSESELKAWAIASE